MPGPVLRRATLLSCVLLCVAVESPPPARAAAGAPPKTMQGFLRYQIRGLTAVSGGFLAGMFAAQGMYVATAHRMLPGVFKILSGMAKLSNDPSMAEMNNFLRSGGPGIDLSSLPVSAGRDIELHFILEEVKKDEFRLKRGNVRWSADTYASIRSGDAEITDKYRGQGSAPLDPKTSSITYVTSGKKGSREAQLDVAVQFPGDVDGKSILRSPVASISIQERGDKQIWETKSAFGFSNREVKDNPPSTGGVWFTKRGHPDSLRKGREIYQDLLDSGVLEEWELWSECSAAIRYPTRNDELVYDDRKPGRLVDTAFAEVKPSFWDDDLHWEFEEIQGSKLDPPPEKANGNDFDIIYTNLPEKNSAFKFGEVKARFDTDRAKRAGCKDPEPREVGYFFNLDAVNHGGPPGPRPDKAPPAYKPNPNWFHYWMQTKANVGLPINFVRYGGEGGGCGEENGYHLPGDKYIVLCDGAESIGYNPLAPLDMPEGIDNFAATLLHEKQHHDNYWLWWPSGYGTPANRNFDLRDRDRDDIPDLLESSLPVPPQVKSKTGRTRFSPNAWDSFGYEINDEHYLAYAAEFRWTAGSAKSEDWSCPGQQTRICGL